MNGSANAEPVARQRWPVSLHYRSSRSLELDVEWERGCQETVVMELDQVRWGLIKLGLGAALAGATVFSWLSLGVTILATNQVAAAVAIAVLLAPSLVASGFLVVRGVQDLNRKAKIELDAGRSVVRLSTRGLGGVTREEHPLLPHSLATFRVYVAEGSWAGYAVVLVVPGTTFVLSSHKELAPVVAWAEGLRVAVGCVITDRTDVCLLGRMKFWKDGLCAHPSRG
jgi:hypothetical protein